MMAQNEHTAEDGAPPSQRDALISAFAECAALVNELLGSLPPDKLSYSERRTAALIAEKLQRAVALGLVITAEQPRRQRRGHQ